jgi:hypothetical protein
MVSNCTASVVSAPINRCHSAFLFVCVAICEFACGCAAITNPVANGIPVRLLPPELLAGPVKESLETIPLTLLKQPPPKVYQLGPHDVLGIFIEGVLPATAPDAGRSDPPVYFPSQIDPLNTGLQPALGFPIPVGADGTIALPLIEPVPVNGLSVTEATAAIKEAYLKKQILQPGRERVFVTLMQPRRTRVTVFRQEVGGLVSNVRGFIATSTTKRGVAASVDLRAYENDVLTAIRETGGLPGLDVYDAIFIFRGSQSNPALLSAVESLSPGQEVRCLADLAPEVVVIPTRLDPHAPLPFRPEDIILSEGDVVFLEARAIELFYTGGLLPSGEYILPRDYDLDVIEAVAQVKGSLLSGAFAGSNLSGLLVQPGLGNPSPSHLTVIRKTPGGGQVPIVVDLNRALTDPRERIIVRPSDVLILQESPDEAIARYFSQTFNFRLFSRIIETSTTKGDAVLSAPSALQTIPSAFQ